MFIAFLWSYTDSGWLTSADVLHQLFEGIENLRFLTTGKTASKQLCRNFYTYNIRDDGAADKRCSISNRILSKASSVYFSFRCQLSNRHHKQCIKYNDAYINKLEKYAWDYTSRKVKFPNSLATSEKRPYFKRLFDSRLLARLILLKLNNILPHGIFAAGGAFVPTQEKKNNIFGDGRDFVPTQEKNNKW